MLLLGSSFSFLADFLSFHFPAHLPSEARSDKLLRKQAAKRAEGKLEANQLANPESYPERVDPSPIIVSQLREPGEAPGDAQDFPLCSVVQKRKALICFWTAFWTTSGLPLSLSLDSSLDRHSYRSCYRPDTLRNLKSSKDAADREKPRNIVMRLRQRLGREFKELLPTPR